jgi:hypothetical protein
MSRVRADLEDFRSEAADKGDYRELRQRAYPDGSESGSRSGGQASETL